MICKLASHRRPTPHLSAPPLSARPLSAPLPSARPLLAHPILASGALLALMVGLLAATPSGGHSIRHAAGSATVTPSDTLRYAILMQGNPAGSELVWTGSDGSWRSRFAFNDRGRGPELESAVLLGDHGRPVSVQISGLNYLKNPVAERFEVFKRDVEPIYAHWENRVERDTTRLAGPSLYVAMNGSPALSGVTARALLDAPGRCLALLPAGRACVRQVEELEIGADSEGSRKTIRLHAFDGFGFSPSYVWLEEDGTYFASTGGWLNVIRTGWESELDRLAALQDSAEARWLRDLAGRLLERPEGPVAITGARLFDPVSLEIRPGTTVLIEGERIAAVGPDGEVGVPSGAREIEAGGRILLPGLWDMHVHLSPIDGILHLAGGVTSVRDLANDVDQLRHIRESYERGTALGPRVIMAGFLDGPGPFAGPTKALVETEEEARRWIVRYADLGYEQIKLYSSLDTALVPAIAEMAHERGLRVSGHIPAWMTAEEAVRAGYDEIQHANMLFLNFLGDTLDTRTPLRFTAVAAHGAELDLAADSVRDFVRLLAERDIVVDPTVAIFEGMFGAASGGVSPMVAPVAGRLPSQVRRGFLGGGLPIPEGMEETYALSYRRMLELVGALHEAGVRIVAGTDAIAGFALHRELELYAKAGIPAPEVLRIATLGAAEVAGRSDALGSVESGKLADLVIVDGDPTTEMSDIRRTWLVVKGGVLYEPSELYAAIGVEP